MRKIVLLLSLLISLFIIGCGKTPNVKTEVKQAPLNGTIVTPANKYYGKKTTQWVDGKKHGVHREYYKNGQFKEELHYKNGNHDGLTTRWHENGNKAGTCNWVNLRPFGKCTSWHRNGKLWRVKYIDENMHKTGMETEYDEKGTVILKIDHSGKTPVVLINADAEDTKRWIASIEKKKKERAKARKNKPETTSTVHLQCSSENGSPSMSEQRRKTAIYRGKGEGAALGYQMKSNTTFTSHQEAKNFCITNANIEGMSCLYASTYVEGCMSKF